MKNLIFLVFLTIVSMSCCKKREIDQNIICGNGFTPNATHTECLCPLETNYLIAGGTECRPKGEFVYQARASAKNCIPPVPDIVFTRDSIGVMDLGQVSSFNSVILTWGDARAYNGFFANESSLTKLADGRYEYKLKSNVITRTECPQWENRATSEIIYAYGHGISNVENTKMDIQMIYIDRLGVTLDTAYLHLWK
jgi:hypothetical protein